MSLSDSLLSPTTIVGGIDPAMHEAMAGDALSNQGKHAEAWTHYAAAVDLAPSNAQWHWQLGLCEERLGRPYLAIECFQRAIKVDPKFAFAHASISLWFLNNGMIESALAASTKALSLITGNYSIMQHHAKVLEIAGQTDAAWQIVQSLLAAKFALPATIILYARLAPRFGHQNQALDLIQRRLGAGNLSKLDTANLHSAAGDLLDSMARYDEAFAQAQRANSLRRPAYDIAEHEGTFDRLIAYFTRERLAALPRPSEPSEVPVFIVGMPRSGTSLVEQILASHPQTHGAGELDFMYQIWAGTIGMVKAAPQEYPECLDRLTMPQIDGMAQVYLQPLMAMNPSALRITDKLPLNFLHLGLIAILFPKARIIHCRRDAMDTCLSCYMTGFREGHEFKYDLSTLGHFYQQYERMMAHWKTQLDLPILDVQYEDLVADAETQSRRMVEFLGLPWNDRCLQFSRTARPVATASLHQVRRPMYRSSIGRWRHYEKHLNELKMALERK